MEDEREEKEGAKQRGGQQRRQEAKIGIVQSGESEEACPGVEARSPEPDALTDDLSRRVIGAAIEVHRVLGPGFLERVYEEALSVEFGLRGIQFRRQVVAFVDYKSIRVGESRLDFLVEDRLVLELKAIEKLAAIHQAQLISYLRTHGLRLGLLLNFNVPVLKLGIRRVFNARG